MKECCPEAAKLWRIGDTLYYLGLISAIGVTLGIYAWVRISRIWANDPLSYWWCLISFLFFVAVFETGAYIKGKAHDKFEKVQRQ